MLRESLESVQQLRLWIALNLVKNPWTSKAMLRSCSDHPVTNFFLPLPILLRRYFLKISFKLSIDSSIENHALGDFVDRKF